MDWICLHCDIEFLSRGNRKRSFCSYVCHHAYARRHDVILERFWSKVDVRGENECWPWVSTFWPNGYGMFSFFSQTRYHTVIASRFMWVITNGSTYGMFVCHNCPGGDNPWCVNSKHLFLGTHQDNMTDMIQKGRSNFGERYGTSKLTDEKVLEMRALRKSGLTLREISERFDTTYANIGYVLQGKTWKHLLPN